MDGGGGSLPTDTHGETVPLFHGGWGGGGRERVMRHMSGRPEGEGVTQGLQREKETENR